MCVVGRPAIWAALLLYTLFVTSSAHPTVSRLLNKRADSLIPTTLGLDNTTLIRLPHDNIWPSEISLSDASVLYPVPNTAITLNFTHFGSPIPVIRALATIFEARHQVQFHLAFNSEDNKKEHKYEYSTRSNSPTPLVCSVVVQCHGSLELSWLQLGQILEGLTQFSSGAGTDHQVHYQTLSFEVIVSTNRNLGTGVLSCVPEGDRGSARLEERATASAPNAANQGLPKPLNLLSLPANLSLLTTPFSNKHKSPSLPLPGSTLTMSFIWLGPPIAPQTINAALHSSFEKITPHLTPSTLNMPVPNDEFVCVTPATTSASKKAQTTVHIYGCDDILMTWARVNAVLGGLYRFANGIGTAHDREYYRNMDFEVLDGGGEGAEMVVAYGNLLEI